MKRAIATTVSNVNNHRAMLSGVILGACLLVAFFYAINLYTLISRTVAVGNMEKQATAAKSRLATLGSEYLKQTSEITPDKLAEYGLKPGQVTAYINRPYQTASIGGGLARGVHEL